MTTKTTLYTKQGVKFRQWSCWVEGAEVVVEHGQLGGKLTQKRYTAKPKNLGRANATTAEEQAIQEADAKVVKQLKSGYYHTIEEAADHVEFTPMKAQNSDDYKHKLVFPCCIQPKLNGQRLMIDKDGNAWSKQGEPLELPSHWTGVVEAAKVSGGLDGEIWSGLESKGGLSLQKIISAFRKPNRDTPKLKLFVYDIPLKNKKFSERIKPLMNLIMNPYVGVKVVSTYKVSSFEEAVDLTNKFVKCGYEGAILRNEDGLYEFGKRSYDLQKLQFIHYKIHPNIESIFQSFDFEHVMGAFDFATEEFVLHENFMKVNAQRLMQFNPTTDFPITSMMRVQKYKERQYTISKAQMLRIAFTIANKEYASWEDVKSEVSGLYGIAPEDMFDETKPFSLEEVVLQLDKLVLNDKYVNTKQPTFQECVDLMKHNFSDNFNNYLAQFEDDDENSKEIWWFPKDKYYKAQVDKYDAEKKYTVPTLTEVVNAWIDPPEEEVDDYGNPVSGDQIINCCFPDCGCDGARCCQAENGASSGAHSMNIERGTLKF